MANLNKEIDRLYSYTFTILLTTGEGKYALEKKSPVEGCVVTHIAARRSGRNPDNKVLCNATALASAHLALQKGTTKVHDLLPLEHVFLQTEKALSPGLEVNLFDVDWARSQVVFGNTAAIVTGEVVELTLYFRKKV